MKIKESDLAKAVIKFLSQDGWDIYQEVQCGEKIADIVAVRDGITMIVECKTTFGIQLMEQVLWWRQMQAANFICVATPSYKNQDDTVRKWFLRQTGIGHIKINFQNKTFQQVLDYLPSNYATAPTLIRNSNFLNIKDYLHEAQKTYAEAGNNNGKRWTPFTQTREEIYNFVKKNPGCSIKEMMRHIKHHWATDQSAYCCLTKYLGNDPIPFIRVERDGKSYKLYYCDGSK